LCCVANSQELTAF